MTAKSCATQSQSRSIEADNSLSSYNGGMETPPQFYQLSLRTLLIIAALAPALIAKEPLAIFISSAFAACVLAALTVEAIDAIARRMSRGRR